MAKATLSILAPVSPISVAERAERARLVDRRHNEAGREQFPTVRIDVPAHVEPAVRLVVEGGERRRLYRIDRDRLRPASVCRRYGRPARRRRSARNAPARRRASRGSEWRSDCSTTPGALNTSIAAGLLCRTSRARRLEPHSRRGLALLAEVRIDRTSRHRRNRSRRGRRRRKHPRARRARAAAARLSASRPRRAAGPLEGAGHDLPAEPGILHAHGLARRAADGGARLAGDDERLPGRRRRHGPRRG